MNIYLTEKYAESDLYAYLPFYFWELLEEYVHEKFDINRGERRGWNPMFYPEHGHEIEANYIKPILKTPKDIRTLVTKASKDAFCCSKSIEELKTLNHSGALAWINRFKYSLNNSNKPLPDVLKKNNLYWYEMDNSRMADLVTSVNPDKRIFFSKLNPKSFVDQRFIPLVAKNSLVDIDLFHALLNSILGIFFIESLGFGRGQEALDLSAKRVKQYLRVLNPELLTEKQIILIKNKFILLRDREIKPIIEELEESDRIAFDNVVLEAFGILHFKDRIINSFLYLYDIRKNIRK